MANKQIIYGMLITVFTLGMAVVSCDTGGVGTASSFERKWKNGATGSGGYIQVVFTGNAFIWKT